MKKSILVIMILGLAAGLFPALKPSHAQDNIELTFLHIFPDERDIRRTTVQAIADAYMEEHPNVTVTIELSTDQYADVFDGALRAAGQGNPPDIVMVEDSFSQLAIDSQLFVKISDYATEEHMASISDILPAVQNYYGLSDGEIWGMPWNASNPIMFYNAEMFTAAGLDPNDPPQTFDEIMAACEAIMSAEIENLQGCINWPVTSWLPEQWLSMQNVLFTDNENGHTGRVTSTNINSEPMLRIFQWWKELADKGYFTYSGKPNDYTNEGLMFITKRTAIHFNSSAALSNIVGIDYPDDREDKAGFAETLGKFTPMAAPLPKPDESATNGISVGGAAVWVMAGNSEEETRAAVDFIFYLINTENQAQWHTASGYFPIRQSSIDLLESEGWFESNPYFHVPLDQILTVEPNPANAGAVMGAYIQVRSAVADAIISMIGGESPEAVLEAAQARADQAIAEYNAVIGG